MVYFLVIVIAVYTWAEPENKIGLLLAYNWSVVTLHIARIHYRAFFRCRRSRDGILVASGQYKADIRHAGNRSRSIAQKRYLRRHPARRA